MSIYEDKSFKDYVNGLPAATESDVVAGNNMPLVGSNNLKKLGGDKVLKPSDFDSNIKNFEVEIVGNILAVVDLFENKSINNSGVISDDENCYSTDFIDIKEGLFFKGKSNDGKSVDLVSWRILYTAYYDSEKNFISRELSYTLNPYLMTVPDGCKYVRFSLSNSNAKSNNVYVGYSDLQGVFDFSGSFNVNNQSFSISCVRTKNETGINNGDSILVSRNGDGLRLDFEKTFSQKPFDLSLLYINGIDLKGNFSEFLTITDGVFLDKTSGSVKANAVYVTTGFVPCDGSHKPVLGYKNKSGGLSYYIARNSPIVCFYDKYYRFIGYQENSSYDELVLNVPDGTCFARFTFWKNVFGTSNSDKYISYEKNTVWTDVYYTVFSKPEPKFFEKSNIPTLKMSGDFKSLTVQKNSIVASCMMNLDGTEDSCFVKVKYQGSSSLNYEKKNYSVQFFNDEAATEKKTFVADSSWSVYGPQNKYVLKANFIDFSHCRNIVSAKIWGNIVKSRTTANSNLNSLPNGGAVDGFPVALYINGEYVGVYTFNIPKDKWLFNMDGSTQQAIIVVEEYTDPCKFKSLDGDYSGEKGCDFTIEYNSGSFATDSVITSFNNFIAFVMNNTGDDFKNGISTYLDVEAAIDYFVFMSAIYGSDNWCRNMIFVTFDGVKWIPSAYDMDSTFGTGPMIDSEIYYPKRNPISESQSWNNLWGRLFSCYKSEIYARYNQLRTVNGKDYLSDEMIYTTLNTFAAKFPKSLLDEEQKMYPNIPRTNVSNVGQMMEFFRLRNKYNDTITNP